MSSETFNGSLSLTSGFGNPTSSALSYYFQIDGDTISIGSQRVISSSTSPGYPGEICIGIDGGFTYLYYCVALNSWQRLAFSTSTW